MACKGSQLRRQVVDLERNPPSRRACSGLLAVKGQGPGIVQVGHPHHTLIAPDSQMSILAGSGRQDAYHAAGAPLTEASTG